MYWERMDELDALCKEMKIPLERGQPASEFVPILIETLTELKKLRALVWDFG